MRIRSEIPKDCLYRVAEGHLLGDVLPERGPAAMVKNVARLRMMLAQIVGGRPELAERLGPLMSKEMDAIPFVNALAHLVLPDVDARQQYLELDSVVERIERLETLLAGAVSASIAQA
jgi:hypothetical protein